MEVMAKEMASLLEVGRQLFLVGLLLLLNVGALLEFVLLNVGVLLGFVLMVIDPH